MVIVIHHCHHRPPGTLVTTTCPSHRYFKPESETESGNTSRRSARGHAKTVPSRHTHSSVALPPLDLRAPTVVHANAANCYLSMCTIEWRGHRLLLKTVTSRDRLRHHIMRVVSELGLLRELPLMFMPSMVNLGSGILIKFRLFLTFLIPRQNASDLMIAHKARLL